ncbi:MAG: hypothetical protein BGO63_03870 [Candidatus Accumulibacter sp. 66-26]|nr:MAG: hypothetical protein BGO63_03870 [Candidatus Accumulibacter sp. 66-26]
MKPFLPPQCGQTVTGTVGVMAFFPVLGCAHISVLCLPANGVVCAIEQTAQSLALSFEIALLLYHMFERFLRAFFGEAQ